MSLYYSGNLQQDMENLYNEYTQDEIDDLIQIGKQIGYGEAQRILQILWAKELDEKGYKTSGALFR